MMRKSLKHHKLSTCLQGTWHLSLLLILLLIFSSVHVNGFIISPQEVGETDIQPLLASHDIYGIAQYSDGVLAAAVRIEVVSSYVVLSDWTNALGEWSVDVGDPGPNWADGTYFTVYAIGCCNHDGWSGGKEGIVSGDENNMGTIILTRNQPPETPSVPTGPAHVLIGMEETYTTSSVDPNYKHTIEYRFDWDSDGDHNYSQFTPSTPSGVDVSLSHYWNETGEYLITAIARDSYGSKSAWSSGLLVTVYSSNNPPDAPSIDGADEVAKNWEYQLSLVCNDPDDHDVFYYIDWDDGTTTSWIGPYGSDDPVSVTHSWDEIGSYELSVKARDVIGEESAVAIHNVTVLGPSLSIRSVGSEQGSVFVKIENSGKVDAEYIEWSIDIVGKRLFNGKSSEGIIYVIEGLSSEIIRSDPVLGFGFNYDVSVSIQYAEEDPLAWRGTALIFFTFIMIW